MKKKPLQMPNRTSPLYAMSTLRSRKVSNIQVLQRQLWQALGTVKGFNGYLHNLQHVVGRTCIYQHDKQRLNSAILELLDQLRNTEQSIRTELSDL